jgi:hypothetical protein
MSGARKAACIAMLLGGVLIPPALVTASEILPQEGIDAPQILAAWAQALGGRERLEGVRTWHRVSQAQMFGLEGTVQEWLAADGRGRLDLDLGGVFKITIVTTSDHCWLRDQNGKVSEQAGKDRQDAIDSVYFGIWSHLLPGRTPGQAKLLGRHSDGGLLVLEIAPDGGNLNRIFLDPQSSLPVRIDVASSGGETLVTTLSEWREFDGILYPGRTQQSTGDPRNDMAFELVSVTHNEQPPAGTFEQPSESADDAVFASGNAAENIPLDLNGVHIFLQGRLNDSEPLWFILDTGASVTVIDAKLAAERGFQTEGQIMGDGVGEKKAEVAFIKDATFSVPGAEVRGQTVAAVDLGGILEARFGRPIDGILGYDFISRFVVAIDYAASRMHLFDRREWRYDGDGVVVPIELVGSQPHCRAAVKPFGREPISCTLMIDTGSSGALSFNKPFSDEHDLLATLPKKVRHTGGYGIGGESSSDLGRVDSLQLGDLTFSNPFVALSLDKGGVGADVHHAGLIGSRVLEQCTVIFDYERQRMILEPNARFGRPIQFDMSGLTFDTGGRADWHVFTIRHVLAASPGAHAGLQVGDVILAVDGKLAAELWKRDITALFQEEGRKVRLKIDRQGEILETTLHLQPLL